MLKLKLNKKCSQGCIFIKKSLILYRELDFYKNKNRKSLKPKKSLQGHVCEF